MEVPAVETAAFLNWRKSGNTDSLPAEIKELAAQVADIFRRTGILIVRDPRVSQEDNDRFLNLMEDYFNQPDEAKAADARPDLGFQVGVTPEKKELPRCSTDEKCQEYIKTLPETEKPVPLDGPDVKWRYFWRVGPRPEVTRFEQLNAPEVIPKGFPNFPEVMDHWGTLMMNVVETVCELSALGFDLPIDAFTSICKYGPHLLAPTGSDLTKYQKLKTVFAGFHYDLNFLTIHGKSRYPGLFAWTREGKKLPVRVPDGCLLLQAGKQFEWATGGEVQAGFHEVIVTEDTLKAVEKQKAVGRPLWRISSTLFFHVASDSTLKPLGNFSNPKSLQEYPPTFAGDQVSEELKYIKLMV